MILTKKLYERLDTIEQRILDVQNSLISTDQRVADAYRDIMRVLQDEMRQMNQKMDVQHALVDQRIADVYRDVMQALRDVMQALEVLQAIQRKSQADWLNEALAARGQVAGSHTLAYIKEIRELLTVKKVQADVLCFFRAGRDSDGGYVMWDDLSRSRVAYSFGIADDVSWEQDMAARGLDIYMYDHTIEGLPLESERFHWQKIGLCGAADSVRSDLQSLESIVAQNHHLQEQNMLLKIDIEGCEWDVLGKLSLERRRQFSQIVIEMHDLNDMQKRDEIKKALQALNETHQLVHVHANNYMGYMFEGGCLLPDVLEGTYLNKAQYSFLEAKCVFPTEWDRANDSRYPDIFLGNWGKC